MAKVKKKIILTKGVELFFIPTPATPPKLLLMDGSALLLQTGDKLLTQS